MPVKVGGPAVELMPDYLKGTEVGHEMPGVLQRINPLATRTTTGCPCRCRFCGVPRIEGKFVELEEFHEGPIVCDNNFLASSPRHQERVVGMLRGFGWADFNQGLDASLVTRENAELIASIGKPIIRMALDSWEERESWSRAFELWREAGVPKKRIRSYVLIGFEAGPELAWDQCRWIERFGVKPLPMWYTPLNAMKENMVIEDQEAEGWSDYERRKIMQWFYKHKMAVREEAKAG
jgi:hypothetical protein